MKKALTCLLCLLMLALATLAVADSADGPITCSFSGAPYGGQDVIVSFPSDYTIHYSGAGAGGIESVSNGQIEVKLEVRDGSAHSSVEEFVEAYADGLRKYKSGLEVRHENGVCYLYEPDGGGYPSGMVTGYYWLGGHVLQVEAVTMDLSAHAEEAIAIVTGGVFKQAEDSEPVSFDPASMTGWASFTHASGMTFFFPADFTLETLADGSLLSLSSPYASIKVYAYARNADYPDVADEAAFQADVLRGKGQTVEVGEANGICYLYALDGEAWQSGTVTAYYDLNEQTKTGWWRTFQLTVNVKDMNQHGEEAIAIATSGVLNP